MAVTEDTPSFAIIDGAFCKINRRGTVVKRRAPLGSAVSEFLVHDNRVIVLESDYGFLLGMPNLYSLDDTLHTLWLAELPSPTNAYAGPLKIEDKALVCSSREGKSFKIDLISGKAVELANEAVNASSS